MGARLCAPTHPVDNTHYFFARSGITNINRIPKTIIARACSVVSRFGLTRYKTAKPSNAIVRFRDSSPGITRVAMMQNAIIAMATSMVPVSLFRVITGRLARRKASPITYYQSAVTFNPISREQDLPVSVGLACVRGSPYTLYGTRQRNSKLS